MTFNWRKTYVLIMSLQAVLIAFLLYSRICRSPRPEVVSNQAGPPASTNGFPDDVGMVGDLGVGPVHKAKYTHLDEHKQLEREFGFEKLLHKQADEWVIQKPYINIFRPDFKCYVTADTGQIQVDDSLGKPSPKDVTLRGNVVIHIVPTGQGNLAESFIYLDDVAYFNDQTRFFTNGPVKFVSDGIDLLGKGMEVIYNVSRDRLELFRIIQLDSLRLKTGTRAGLAGILSVDDTAKHAHTSTNGHAAERTSPTPLLQPTGQSGTGEPTDLYRCVFSKNVVIDGPRELIFADQIAIINIPGGKNDTAGTENNEQTPDESNTATESVSYVFVTCDAGITVTPTDSAGAPMYEVQPAGQTARAGRKVPRGIDYTGGRTSFIADKITYDLTTGEVTGLGASELTLHQNKSSDTPGAAQSYVKINAQEKTVFSTSSNRALFQGDCEAMMVTVDSNSTKTYNLRAPTLTVDLPATPKQSYPQQGPTIKHMVASDGVTVTITNNNNPAGPATFTAETIDYDGLTNTVTAPGPCRLTFHARPQAGSPNGRTPTMVTVSSQTRAVFLPDQNRAVFEGDCLCTMTQTQGQPAKRYSLSAPAITVDLASGNSTAASGFASGIEWFTARGPAILVVSTTADGKELTTFVAEQISYTASQGDFVATGPTRLTFYAEENIGSRTNDIAVPVTITAREKTTFSPANNKVWFSGDCRCTMLRTVSNRQTQYTLSAPSLVVGLAAPPAGGSVWAADISEMVANGGALVTITRVPDAQEYARLTAESIVYNAAENKIVAPGPCQLDFLTRDITATSSQTLLPVRITAEEKATFLPSTNTAVFEGQTLCVVSRPGEQIQTKYTLTAPRLAVVVTPPADSKESPASSAVRYVTADGGVVQLSTVKANGSRLLGFTKLKAVKLEFDAVQQLCIATGPGVVSIDNSKIPRDIAEMNPSVSREQLLALAAPEQVGPEGLGPAAGPGADSKGDSKGGFYGFVQNFDKLNYYVRSKRMVAYSNDDSMLIDYIPAVENTDSQHIKISAKRVAANLVQTAAGQFSIDKLVATGGVSYEDLNNQFVASRLFYDAAEQIITADGNPFQQCLVNGTVVDSIVYDLKTHRTDAEVTSPGALQVRNSRP